MIPILYEANETAFTTNGLGRLSDCISCTVTEERNGRFDLTFDYPVNGIHFEDITEGRIVAVTHDTTGDVQPFVIWQSSKPIDGIVTFTGYHISYYLAQAWTAYSDYQTLTCQQILTNLQAYAGEVGDWTFTTDITGTTTNFGVDQEGEAKPPRTVREDLGGSEGSVLDIFGGEYKFDKWNVQLLKARGANKGVKISYGKNLTDFRAETDLSGSATAILGYYTGDYLITNPITGTNDKTHGNIYTIYRSTDTLPGNRTATKAVDFSSNIENGETKLNTAITAELTTLARKYYTENKVIDPAVSMDIDFVQLWETEEFKEYAPLLKCDLCDTVNVSFGVYGLRDVAVKVVAVEWDPLAERYNKMTLGGLATTLADAINGELSGSVKANADAISNLRTRSYVSDVTVNGSSVVTDGVAAIAKSDISSAVTMGSGFTGRIKKAYEFGSVVQLVIAVNRGGSNFSQGRTSNVFTIAAGHRPLDTIDAAVSASNAVNSYANRWANVLITSAGAGIIDCYGYSDVKEVIVQVTYLKG